MWMFLISLTLDDIRKKYLQAEYMEAYVVERISGSRGEMVFKGRLVVERAKKLTFVVEEPYPQTIIVEGETMYVVQGTDTLVQELGYGHSFDPYAFITQIDDNSATLRVEGSRIVVDVLELEEPLKKLRLVFRKDDLTISEIYAQDSFGNTYEFKFSKVVLR